MVDSRGFPDVPGDRYRIEREIARGGMATVYLAHDERHDRSVAIKVMHPEVAMAMGRERFLREIKLAAKLSHPNILTVHDSGESSGSLWYVMPYVEGETLRQRLNKEGRLQVHEVLRLMHEAAEAIGYAHSLGVVHRDIKPENILLSRGHSMIADFGVARAIDVARDDHLTSSGVALGTTAYMSPEQALAEDVDARADVWALGCVMYEMLCGSPPFGSGGREVVTRSLAGKREPLPKVRPLITREVEAIVDKALANDKHDRFPTATQLAEAIEQVHDTGKQVIVAHHAGESSAKRKLVYAGVAAGAVLAIAAASTLWNGGKEETPAVPSLHQGSDSIQELIRLGRVEGARRTASGSARAISLLMQAVAKDSMVPAAWAELAYAADFANSRSLPIPGISRDSLVSLALGASERAIALDPDNARSWLIKARTSRMMDPTDLRPALFGIRKALSIDSTNARGWFDLGTVRMESLDNAGSFAAWKRSADLNPTDPQTLSFLGLNRLWAHDYQAGIKWTDSAIALDPMYRLARESKGQLLVESEHPLEAVQQYEIAMRSAAGSETAISFGLIARAYAVGGDMIRAREYVERAMKLVDVSKPPRHEAAWIGAAVAAVGDTVGAVRLLEAYQPRADRHFQMHLNWDPGLRWIKGSRWERRLMLGDPVKQ